MISFNWDIHLLCNYKCPYCWWYGKEEEIQRKNCYVDIESVIQAWQNIYRKYGTVFLSITGGEPFLYPQFDKFLIEISKIHKIKVVTNLSLFDENIIDKINKENIIISPSFHPLSADIDLFLKKANKLEKEDILYAITLVGWPPFLKDVKMYQQKIYESGLKYKISIQPFHGVYNNKHYPESYSDDEKLIVDLFLGNREKEIFAMQKVITKGKKCRAGQFNGVIFPNGNVKRCAGFYDKNGPGDKFFGNIFDEKFSLLKESSECTFDDCPCNEWSFLLEE